jgi:hypothetical protein
MAKNVRGDCADKDELARLVERERDELPDEPFALPDVEPIEWPDRGEQPATVARERARRPAPVVVRDDGGEPGNLVERERYELVEEPFVLPDVEPSEPPDGESLDPERRR